MKPEKPRSKGLIKRSLEQALGIAELAGDALGGTASMVGITGEAALKIAQASLRKTTLTLPLPEPLLNHQLRQRLAAYGDLDHLSISCGDDSLRVRVDAHFHRVVYTLDLSFAITEYVVSAEQRCLRLQQIDEALDAQLRQAPFAVNWVARQASSRAFRLINKLPLPSLASQVIEGIPGIHAEGHRRWRIDLDEAGLTDFIENRAWMLERLDALTDFSILPGLKMLRESRELMLRLTDQFEIRGLRVQPGRLEVRLGIGTTDTAGVNR